MVGSQDASPMRSCEKLERVGLSEGSNVPDEQSDVDSSHCYKGLPLATDVKKTKVRESLLMLCYGNNSHVIHILYKSFRFTDVVNDNMNTRVYFYLCYIHYTATNENQGISQSAMRKEVITLL